ncbi:MAG: hypothetical protein RLZZ273_712 [Bacteroidota bacterium]|jgi:hypothetical protein
MLPLSRIIWPLVVNRHNRLIDYRDLVVKYLNSIVSLNQSNMTLVNELRSQINERMPYIDEVVRVSGVATHMSYTPMRAIPPTTYNLVTDLFGMHEQRVPMQNAIDLLERTIGAHKAQMWPSAIRIFNPFYWVGLIVELVASLIFSPFHAAGLNTGRLEYSLWVRSIKGLITMTATILTILVGLDQLNIIRFSVVKGWLGGWFE